MTNKSNDNGRAYEYVCLMTLYEEISKRRHASFDRNSSFEVAQNAWSMIDEGLKKTLTDSAKAAVYTIFDLEPLIVEKADDKLTIRIQPDNKGEKGDVRDIVVERESIRWEIGFSLKHNHFAVRHNRLSARLDFCKKWLDMPCSDKYWDDVRPVFGYLETEKQKGTFFESLPKKDDDVYVPVLKAFIDEIRRKEKECQGVPTKMVEYLLGMFDFYKIISLDNRHLTQIQTYNLRGTLNKPCGKHKPKIIIPVASLPIRIVYLDFKPESKTTVEMYLDSGWQFSFRIHNAEKVASPSLKFDIQLIGIPIKIMMLNCKWH